MVNARVEATQTVGVQGAARTVRTGHRPNPPPILPSSIAGLYVPWNVFHKVFLWRLAVRGRYESVQMRRREGEVRLCVGDARLRAR